MSVRFSVAQAFWGADVSFGEHRLPACPFWQPAEKLIELSRRRILAALWGRRQAADDNRLAACAPQRSETRVLPRPRRRRQMRDRA